MYFMAYSQPLIPANYVFFRDRVAAHDKVQNGEVDMNELCTQLKQKAKCSGTGAVIEQKDVDDLLGPSAEHQKDYLKMFT